ncbi:MAG: redoxin family protein [bacterium]|nr:redoxin family protein [bacterium]
MKIRLAVSALLATGLASAQQSDSPRKPSQQNASAAKPQHTARRKLQIGDELPPDVTLQDLEGDLHRVGDLRGRPVVIHMWSSTCPWQHTIDPKLVELARDYDSRGVTFLGLAANVNEIGKKPAPAAFEAHSPDDRPYRNLRQRAEDSDLRHPILADHGARLARTLAARTTGQVFVIDATGRLVYRGALDDDGRGTDPSRAANHVRDALDATIRGTEVATPQTPPYGGPTRFD